MFRTLLSIFVCTSMFLAAAPQKQPPAKAFGRPLVFEPNRGQAPAEVQWLARGAGYQLGFTAEGATLVLRGPTHQEPPNLRKLRGADLAEELSEAERSARTSFVKLRLFGSRAWSAKGLNPTGGASHYLLGDEPEQWRTDIPHYARVKAAGVYEGIDVIFYGREGVLEYDFVVAPGADPQQIQLEFEGAAKVQLDAKSGDLLLTTSTEREVRMGKPNVYQEMGGRKLDVKSSYQILDNGRAAFTLADYDRRLPLVIDPTVMFTKLLGGSSTDQAHSIAVDSLGNSYTTGLTDSANFPDSGGVQGNSAVTDAFVTKLSPTGTVLFSTYLGGSGVDYGMGIAVDSSAVYVTGHTRSKNFPRKQALSIPYREGEAFVTKLSPLGNSIIYSTFVGGSKREFGDGIAVDSSQSVYVVGQTLSKDFPVVGGFQRYPGDPDFVPLNGFVAKLSPNGTSLVYSTYLGGTSYDYVASVAIDSSLSAYVTGETCSQDFPIAGLNPLPFPGTCTGFVTKFSPAGNSVIYSTFLVNNIKNSTGIALDAARNAYVTGICTLTINSVVREEAFVAKLNQAGGLYYFRFLRGNNGSSWARGIATDAVGNAWVVGATTSTSFPGAPPITPNPYTGFLVKYDPNGNGPLSTTLLGAQINAVSVQGRLIYTVGYRYTGGTAYANRDAFVVKLTE